MVAMGSGQREERATTEARQGKMQWGDAARVQISRVK